MADNREDVDPRWTRSIIEHTLAGALEELDEEREARAHLQRALIEARRERDSARGELSRMRRRLTHA